jgi:hypothetical protein
MITTRLTKAPEEGEKVRIMLVEDNPGDALLIEDRKSVV